MSGQNSCISYKEPITRDHAVVSSGSLDTITIKTALSNIT
jgi:hypothetical protein